MQTPTLSNVRIRSTRDALHVFHGVARNILPLITRRLDAEERRAIAPGNVYVWEERGANTESTGIGMERWTDGMGWGPSRVRDEFLFYHQKESEHGEDASTASTPWAQMISVYPANHPRGTSESERLIKQTYSVLVSLPADRLRGIIRKWHLTAYFSQQRLDSLVTVDTIPDIGDVNVPEGWFRSARAGKVRRDQGQKQTHTPVDSTAQRPRKSPLLPSNGSPNLKRHVSVKSRHDPRARSLASNRSGHRSSTSPFSDQSTSPRRSSSSLPLAVTGQLIPLQHLQTSSYIRRDPADEQLLRKFSVHPLRPTFCDQRYRGS